MEKTVPGIPVVRSPITVLIPADLKAEALRRHIGFSATLVEALTARIEHLERAELAGKLAPGHHPHETEAS